MKKISTRSIILTLLIAASLGAYLYLQHASIHISPDQDSREMVQETMIEEETGTSASEIILPDVQLLKKVVETGKRFIPAQ